MVFRFIVISLLLLSSCVVFANEYIPHVYVNYDEIFDQFNQELEAKGVKPLEASEKIEKQLIVRGLDKDAWYLYLAKAICEAYSKKYYQGNECEKFVIKDYISDVMFYGDKQQTDLAVEELRMDEGKINITTDSRGRCFYYNGKIVYIKKSSEQNYIHVTKNATNGYTITLDDPSMTLNDKDYTPAALPSGISDHGIDDIKASPNLKGGEIFCFGGKIYVLEYHSSGEIRTIEVDRNGVSIEKEEPSSYKDKRCIQPDKFAESDVENEHEFSQVASKKIVVYISRFDLFLIISTLLLFFFLGRLSVKK